ncbi:MAG: lysylphosphatidylglycerol synthase domain-containing protein, partial [Solirubrobacterales bacterium]
MGVRAGDAANGREIREEQEQPVHAVNPNGQTMAHRATRLERAGAAASRAASLRPADPNIRTALYVVIGLVIALSVALAAWSSFAELPELDWHFRPGWIALAVVSMAALILVNAELWRRLLGALGQDLPARRATAIWCVSALGRYVPTSLMMPVMRAALAEREEVPKRITLASVIYELALGFTAVLIVGAFFIVDTPELSAHSERYAVIALPMLALIVLQPRFFRGAADFVLQRLGRQ